jgi:hypothetical protein
MAALRCPPAAAADVRALSQQPAPPPSGDVTRAAAEAWIDRRGAQLHEMRLAGRRVIRQLDRCRKGTPTS